MLDIGPGHDTATRQHHSCSLSEFEDAQSGNSCLPALSGGGCPAVAHVPDLCRESVALGPEQHSDLRARSGLGSIGVGVLLVPLRTLLSIQLSSDALHASREGL